MRCLAAVLAPARAVECRLIHLRCRCQTAGSLIGCIPASRSSGRQQRAQGHMLAHDEPLDGRKVSGRRWLTPASFVAKFT